MTDSFTDELIKDLDQNEKDTKRAGISRLKVLKETIEDIEDPPVYFIYGMFIILTLFFARSTYGVVSSFYQIPLIEEGMFQVFEVRGVSVEELDQNDHILSGVLENIELNFVELEDLAQQDGMVYYSRNPSTRFFIVDEYGDVVYYYVNDRLDKVYSKMRGGIGVVLIAGACLFVLTGAVYRLYKIKYREMIGF